MKDEQRNPNNVIVNDGSGTTENEVVSNGTSGANPFAL
jgi:hypothetical protein